MQHHYFLHIFIALVSAVIYYSGDAQAQVTPGNFNNSVRPDTQQQRFKIEDRLPSVSGDPLVTIEDNQGVRPLEGDVSFVLRSVDLQGATAFNEDALREIFEDQIGEEVSLASLRGIVSKITGYYRNNGFILTRATLPPQRFKIEEGAVTIRIVEGFVSQVSVVGDGADDPLIKAYGEKIRAAKPLDSATLERYLLLMDDLPGVEARAVLQQSPDIVGASEVIVNVKRQSFQFSASFDNRGSRFLGPAQVSATGSFNNLLGLNDQTQLRVVNTPIENQDQLVFGELRHEQQIGAEGTKLVLSASHVETQPGATLELFEIVGQSTAFSAGISYPYLRSRRENLFLNATFTVRNVDVDTLGADLFYDKTRVLALGASYDFVDNYNAINRIELTASNGFGFGTDVENQVSSRANGEESFFKLSGSASRIQPIDGPWSAFFAASGQYSANPLFASEEFALGGAQFGSAYDPAEITGDSGLAGRAELQYNDSGSWIFTAYQFYGFYDIGRVWNRNAIVGSEAVHSSLSSTGVGTRFNVEESVSGSLELALPLTREVAAFGQDGGKPRVFFNLQYRY